MFKRHEIVLGFLFATAIWAVVAGLQSDLTSKYEICEYTKAGQKECAPYHLIPYVLWRVINFLNDIAVAITAFATIAIALFTLTLKRSTDKLWDVTDRALKSTERSLEALERARMFHGYSPLRFRDDQAQFTLRMVNVGRMPGRVTQVGWKFLARNNLPPTREERDWEWEPIEYDYIVRPQGSADIATFLSLVGVHVFVTFIEYEDLYTRKIHTSWMGMRIDPNGKETRAGGDAWNDWT